MIRGSNFKHNVYFLQETDKGGKSEGGNIDFIDDGEGGAGAGGNAPQKKRRAKRAGQPTLALEGIQNEELSALEAHMLRLSRLGKGYYGSISDCLCISLLHLDDNCFLGFKVSSSERELGGRLRYMVAAILRTLRDPRTLPVCSSIMIDEYPVWTWLVN